MYDRWPSLIIFLLCNPHLLESWKRGQNWSADPNGVFSLRWSNNFYLHRTWSKSSNLLLHPICNTWIHGGTPRENVICIQILADINITLHYGIVGRFMNTSWFHSYKNNIACECLHSVHCIVLKQVGDVKLWHQNNSIPLYYSKRIFRFLTASDLWVPATNNWGPTVRPTFNDNYPVYMFIKKEPSKHCSFF